MKMHDDLFGDLSVGFMAYDGQCDVPLFGETKKFDLTIRTFEDGKIDDAQREIFADLMAHKEAYAQQAENAVFHYYLSECDDFREMLDPETADENAPIITEISQLKNLISGGGVSISPFELHGKSFVLFYDGSWDEEGVGVRFVDGVVVKVSEQFVFI